MKVIKVKPYPGKKILNPDCDPPEYLPAEGLKVIDSLFWRRRVKAGDVELARETEKKGRK